MGGGDGGPRAAWGSRWTGIGEEGIPWEPVVGDARVVWGSGGSMEGGAEVWSSGGQWRHPRGRRESWQGHVPEAASTTLPCPPGARPCSPKYFGLGAMVCVCNTTYCDTLDPVVLPAVGSYVKYESSKAGKRLERSEGRFLHRLCALGTATDGKGGWTLLQPTIMLGSRPCRCCPQPGHDAAVPEGEGFWWFHHRCSCHQHLIPARKSTRSPAALIFL